MTFTSLVVGVGGAFPPTSDKVHESATHVKSLSRFI